MKWGNKFPASYFNHLYGMVERNLSNKFGFVCFTENYYDLPNSDEVITVNSRKCYRHIQLSPWIKEY